MEIQEKLAKLNPNKYDQRDSATIRNWKERIPELLMQEDFINHPGTKKLAEEARGRSAAIREKLGSDRELLLNPARAAERAYLIAEAEVHELYLTLFTRSSAQEIHYIEKAIDNELQPD
jgi:hypothetical protein